MVHFKQVGSVWNVCSGTFLLARHLFLRKALGTWQQLEPPEYFTDKNYHSEASIGDQGAYTRFLRVSPSADVCHSKILPRYIFAESQILRGTGDLVCICQIVTLTTAFHNKLRFVMVRFVAFCCLGAPSWLCSLRTYFRTVLVSDMMMQHMLNIQHYYHVWISLNDLVKPLTRDIRNVIMIRTVGIGTRADAAIFSRVE